MIATDEQIDGEVTTDLFRKFVDLTDMGHPE